MSVEEEVNVNISAFILCVHYFKQNQQNKKPMRFGLNNSDIKYKVTFNKQPLCSCMLDFKHFVGMQQRLLVLMLLTTTFP